MQQCERNISAECDFDCCTVEAAAAQMEGFSAECDFDCCAVEAAAAQMKAIKYDFDCCAVEAAAGGDNTI